MSRSHADTSVIADRYARAAFALAQESAVTHDVVMQLQTLAEAIDKDAPTKRLLHHPLISKRAKAEALAAVLRNHKAQALTISIVSVLTRSGRLFVLPALASAIAEKHRQARGIVQAEIISARALNDANLASVQAALAQATGKEIALKKKIDPSVLGGLKIRIGSKELDMTLAGALDRTRRALTGSA